MKNLIIYCFCNCLLAMAYGQTYTYFGDMNRNCHIGLPDLNNMAQGILDHDGIAYDLQVDPDGNGKYNIMDLLLSVNAFLDDTPVVSHPLARYPFLDVTIENNCNFLSVFCNDVPNHTSPYFIQYEADGFYFIDQNGDGVNDMYSEPHTGMNVNPNRISEQNYVFHLPLAPEVATSPSATNLGPIGVIINGVTFYNEYEGPDMPLDDQTMNSFDEFNGHPAPNQQGGGGNPPYPGRYHYHVEPLYLTEVESNASYTRLLGYALDGFPVYGPLNPDGSTPELDDYNGEFSPTPEYPNGIYHYHVTDDPPYLIGAFIGTPGSVDN